MRPRRPAARGGRRRRPGGRRTCAVTWLPSRPCVRLGAGPRPAPATGSWSCSTSSPRCRRYSRNPPAIAASTTSLTVQPAASLTRLTSASSARAQPQRRCGPSGPLSTLVGLTALRPTLASPYARTAPARAASPAVTSTAAPHRRRPRDVDRQPRDARHAGCGEPEPRGLAGSGRQAVGARRGASRSRSSTISMSSLPARPSIIAWWVLVMIAQRSPGSPSTSHISHSGRSTSRRWDRTRPTSARSCASPPGDGIAVCRRW